MTVITCGRTNRSDWAEEITRVLRDEQGFRTDGGCGRQFDLDDDIQHMRISRCLECWRWLCEPCIRAHFRESQHDAASAKPDEAIALTEQEAQPAGLAGTSDAGRAGAPLTVGTSDGGSRA